MCSEVTYTKFKLGELFNKKEKGVTPLFHLTGATYKEYRGLHKERYQNLPRYKKGKDPK
ncbi:MAG: hypothetical protein ACRC6V_06680 [Bacteroidales bacterium]